MQHLGMEKAKRCVQTAQYSRSATTIVIVVMYILFFIYNVSTIKEQGCVFQFHQLVSSQHMHSANISAIFSLQVDFTAISYFV